MVVFRDFLLSFSLINNICILNMELPVPSKEEYLLAEEEIKTISPADAVNINIGTASSFFD